MFSRVSQRCALIASMVLTLAVVCGAQVPVLTNSLGNTLRGRVLDQNRDPLAGATIVVSRADGSPVATATTNQNGEFFLALDAGNYTLKVAMSGFAEALQSVRIEQSVSASVEVMLQVAGLSSSVTIVGVDGYQTEEISSATKTLTPLRDTPQSISVVTKEQIKDQSFQSVSDVVNYIPGVSSHQGENNRDQLILRGNSTSADFYLNGVRDDVQYYRDLYNVDRVEALKGPNAMIFGRGGGGGVINRVSKEAEFASFGELSFQGGSYRNRRATGDFGRALNDKVAFRLNGVYENSASFRRFVGLERYGINPTFTIAPNSDTRINVSYEYFHDGRTADRGIPSFQGRPIDVAVSTFFGDPNLSHVRADVHLLSGIVERQFGRFNLHNRTQFGDYDRFYQNFVPGVVTSDKTRDSISSYNNATRRKNIFNQTDLTFALWTGGVKHSLLAGAEFGRQLTDNFRNTGFFNNTATAILVPVSDPIVTVPVTYRQNATDADNHLRTNLAAGYVQDQIEISRYVQVVSGVRFDYFDLRFHNNRKGDNLRRIDQLISPRIGIVVKPVVALSLYGNFSVAYLPSSGDQFSSLTTITQQVKPEKFTNYEAGAKWDLRPRLALTAALYRQDRTNTRATDPLNPTAILQTGSQRTNGFELGINGSVTRNWRVVGGYAHQNAFISSATTAAVKGAQVAQVPHDTFSLWNNYQVARKLGVGLGVIHRADMFAAIDDTVVLPAYTRVEAAVFYSFNENLRLQANLQNLFDKKYYVNADNNNNISPGSPRSARVALTWKF
ncbi:MAG TPA: TonB-dependent siderophore receptor [Pyrinomonadaceae bacterium]|nr:TonB-dependent siderophore receptor [Pyrinomonadaceae bacterium]